MILLYYMMSTYDMITSMFMKLGLYLHEALRSFPYLGSYVLEFVNNQTQSVGKTEGDTFPHSFAPPLSLRLVLTAFENFRVPVGCSGQHSPFVLPPEWVLGLV